MAQLRTTDYKAFNRALALKAFNEWLATVHTHSSYKFYLMYMPSTDTEQGDLAVVHESDVDNRRLAGWVLRQAAPMSMTAGNQQIASWIHSTLTSLPVLVPEDDHLYILD